MATQPQPLNPKNPHRWSYTWEALGHIPTLRLFLFCPEVSPSDRCHNLKADLRPDRSLLMVSWIEGAERMERAVLKVPVPKVLIDFESLLDVSARVDHVEVRLVLVLPVDHPIVLDIRAEMKANADDEHVRAKDGGLMLSLDSDLRNFVELPSVDWKEVADNWFGTCCCSFGGISEKLAQEYINKLALTEGTCLLDPASVIICKDDLEGYVFSDEKRISECDIDDANSIYSIETVTDLGTPDCYGGSTQKIAKPSRCVMGKDEGLKNSLEISALQMHIPTCNSDSVRVSFSESADDIGVSRLSLLESHNDIDSVLKINSSQCSSNSEYSCHHSQLKSTVESHCCFSGKSLHDETTEKLKPTSARMPVMEGGPRLLHISSLASNFMTRTWNRTKDIRWVEFFCRNCSSLLGSYPSFECGNSPVDDGVRLFKFCISTSPNISEKDVFRKYSLQRVFINTLLESASDELSFRTIIRDLNSKSPMLRLILVNSKVWCISGCCLENDVVDPISEINLQPFAKVLYSDFRSEAIGNSRTSEEWGVPLHADELYMLSSQVEELIESLKSSRTKLPISCSELQGMSVSYVER